MVLERDPGQFLRAEMEASVGCPQGEVSSFMNFVVSSGVCAEDKDLETSVLGVMKHYSGRKCRVRKTNMESQEGKKVNLGHEGHCDYGWLCTETPVAPDRPQLPKSSSSRKGFRKCMEALLMKSWGQPKVRVT